MIEAIKNIGEYAVNKKSKSMDEPLDILIGNPKNKDTKYILFIMLEDKNGEFEYRGIDIEQYSENKLRKYLYKKGSPNGTDITPTAMITTIDKTLNNKILGWFKEYNEIGDKEDINFLVKIGSCIRKNREEIGKDLKEKYNKESNIISLKICDKYIGEYEIFKNILLKESKKGFYSKYGKESKSDNQICSVCKQRKEVYGFVDTYKFYTVDKPGFVSGGFQQRYAWKNYPVCLNCALILEEGKKYLKESLDFSFYGLRYLLIPKFVRGVNGKYKKDVFRIIEQQRDPKFTKKDIARLTSDESEILQLMSEQENYLNMNFLFYDAPKGYDGSVFNILLYIEDVLPSRLRVLFDAKKHVDSTVIFKNCMVPVFENKKKTGEEPLAFNFGVLRTFLPKISDNQTYNKYFLDIVSKIFSGRSIDYHFIISFIIKKIREEFVNGYPTNISTLKGFMLLNYLNRLNLLENFKEVRIVDKGMAKVINI